MEYYLKLNGFFYRSQFRLTFITVACLLFSCLVRRDYFLLVLLILSVIVVIVRGFKKLKFWIAKKPLLTVNEFFLFDHQKNIKYYWNDIEEIVADGDLLRIVLKNPEKYVSSEEKQPKRNFFKRKWPGLFESRTSFSFYISDVAANSRQTFLDILDEYSLKAMDLETSRQ